MNRLRIGDGTVRNRATVPGRADQLTWIAGIRTFGTVRAERPRPAESPAKGFAGGCECGAIFLSSPTDGEGR